MHKQIDDEGTDKTTLIQTDSQSVKQTDRQTGIHRNLPQGGGSTRFSSNTNKN